MNKQIDTIVKIGGSITEKGSLKNLNRLGKSISECYQKEPNFMIIPGGGSFAEGVRTSQKKFSFSDETAHWMAILAMKQQALLLREFIPKSRVVSYHKKGQKKISTYYVPILSIGLFMKEISSLPHNWHSTSDAISVEIADHCQAKRIIFVKDVDGVFLNNKLQEKISIDKLLEEKELPFDRNSLSLLRNKEVEVLLINGFYPKRVENALLGKNKILCTKILTNTAKED